MKTQTGTTLVLLVLAAAAKAGIGFSVTADRTTVTVGEQIVITAKVTSTKGLAGLSAPSVPASESFSLLRTSRNQSQSSSIQIVNGKMVQSREITYLFYYFIAPKKEGTFSFPALTLRVDGQSYVSTPFPISVTSQPVTTPDMRVILRVDRTKLYVGQQGVLTLEVAQKPNAPVNPTNQGFGAAVAAIDDACASNFSLNHLFADRIGQKQGRIGGEVFIVYQLRFGIIPLRAGTFTIGPVAYEYEQLQRSRRRDPFDDFFGGFFSGGVSRVPKTALSNRLAITAVDLPPPPRDFSGAVGTFSLSASIDPTELPAGEAATLSITLRGSTRPGNIGEVKPPALDGFDIYPPEKHTFVDTTDAGIKTRKTYKYLVVPNREGEREIGPVSWVYFDPDAGRYKTAASEPLSVSVTKGKKATREQTRYLTQEEIHQIGSDIRYIKTPAKLRHQSSSPQRDPVFFIAFPLPFILAGFSLLYKLQARQRRRDAGRLLRNRAYRNAAKRMTRVEKSSTSLSAGEAASRLYDILEQYVTHRFGFAAAGKTLEELRDEFVRRGADEQTIDRTAGLLEELDTVRFSPEAAGRIGAGEQLAKVRSVVAALEKRARERRTS